MSVGSTYHHRISKYFVKSFNTGTEKRLKVLFEACDFKLCSNQGV